MCLVSSGSLGYEQQLQYNKILWSLSNFNNYFEKIRENQSAAFSHMKTATARGYNYDIY